PVRRILRTGCSFVQPGQPLELPLLRPTVANLTPMGYPQEAPLPRPIWGGIIDVFISYPDRAYARHHCALPGKWAALHGLLAALAACQLGAGQCSKANNTAIAGRRAKELSQCKFFSCCHAGSKSWYRKS